MKQKIITIISIVVIVSGLGYTIYKFIPESKYQTVQISHDIQPTESPRLLSPETALSVDNTISAIDRTLDLAEKLVGMVVTIVPTIILIQQNKKKTRKKRT